MHQTNYECTYIRFNHPKYRHRSTIIKFYDSISHHLFQLPADADSARIFYNMWKYFDKYHLGTITFKKSFWIFIFSSLSVWFTLLFFLTKSPSGVFFRLSFVNILYIFIRTFFIIISIIYHKMIKRVSCKSEWTFFWMPIDYDLSLLEYFFHIFERRHRIGDNRLDCSWRPYQRPLFWQERSIRLSWPISFPSRS